MKYPKIETLFNRDPETHKVVPSQFRRPEFSLVKGWLVTEKIDGTNIRVMFTHPGKVSIAGRTDRAQIPPFLLSYLQETFTPEIFKEAFPDLDDESHVILFGEGYGERIQNGGGYREGVSFRLFDVVIYYSSDRPWWLQWKDVEGVAQKLRIHTVPVLEVMQPLDVAEKLASGRSAVAAQESDLSASQDVRRREGIVARTEPPLFDRLGERVMWKLKERDL